MAKKRVNRVVALGALVMLGLAVSLAWRVHAQRVNATRPSSGSTTVEGVAVIVGSRILGRLTEVSVLEGQAVKRGHVLARLDCIDQAATVAAAEARVRGADAQVEAAEAQSAVAGQDAVIASARTVQARAEDTSAAAELAQVERDNERASRLYRDDAVSLLDKERAETRRKESEAQRAGAGASFRTTLLGAGRAERALKVAEKQIAAARAAAESARADLELAKQRAAECVLVAPQDGVVTERILEPGSIVQPGTPVFQIIDVATAKMTFYVPNAELSRATVGTPAEVRVDAYPDRVFHGSVTRVATEAEFTPRNVQTREDRDRLVYAVDVHVDNVDRALRAGMPADVTLVGGK